MQRPAGHSGNFVCTAGAAQGVHPRRNEQFKHQVEQMEQEWRAAELEWGCSSYGQAAIG